jgi:hypothetical protein
MRIAFEKLSSIIDHAYGFVDSVLVGLAYG